MIRTVLADAAPLYAAIAKCDAYYRQARFEIQYLADNGWEVAVILPTVMEVQSLIQRKLGSAAALRWLREIQTFAGRIV